MAAVLPQVSKEYWVYVVPVEKLLVVCAWIFMDKNKVDIAIRSVLMCMFKVFMISEL